MLKGVIFDLDGTLLDSMWVWDTVAESCLRDWGYEPKPGINELFKTFTLRQAAEHYRDEYGVPMTAEELMQRINKKVEDCYFHRVEFKPGVRRLLSKLKQRGVKMCIATATDRYQVQAALRRLEAEEFFCGILTCSETGCGKDDPTIFRLALECLGTDKTKTLVAEDSLHALMSAKSDGFLTMGVYDPYAAGQERIHACSDIYLPDFLDMKEFWNFANRL